MEVMSSDYTNFGTSQRSPNQSPLSTSPLPEQRISPRGVGVGSSVEQSLHVIVEPQLDGQTNFIHLINPPTGQILSSFIAEHGSHIEIQRGVFFRVPFPHEHGYSYPRIPQPVPQSYSHFPHGMPAHLQNDGSHSLIIPAQQFNPTCPVHGSPGNRTLNMQVQTGDQRLDLRREKLQRKLREKKTNNHLKCSCLKYNNGPHHQQESFLVENENGNFTCMKGKGAPSERLNEGEEDIIVPVPPEVHAVDPYSIVISWENCIATNTNLSQCQFDLQISTKENIFKSIYCGTETCFTASELSPGTEYCFRLCGILNTSTGPYSETVSCSTLCTVPNRPQVPRISQKTKSSLTLKWLAPPDGGCTISYYKLQWSKNHDHDHFDDLYVGLQKQFKHNHKLAPGTPCFYRLQAGNEYGESEFSPILECLTSAGPPAAPDKPEIIKNGVNYIQVKWNEPDSNGSSITEYKLEMEDPSVGYGFMAQFCGLQRSYCCKNLKRNTQYKFRVVAINTQGTSKCSPLAIFSTLPEVPGKMEKPKINGKVKTHSIPVKWDPPKDTGGDLIIGYLLEVDDGKGGSFVQVYHGSDREVVVDQRIPGHTYRLRVASESKAGVGMWSSIANMTTLPVCPKDISPPRLSSQVKQEMTTMYIEWDPPSDTGGAVITNYVIQMATSLSADFEQIYSGPERSCVVNNLSAGTDYRFKLQGSNSAGPCSWSSIATLRTAPGPPDAPLPPLVSFKSPTHVRLDWMEPRLHGVEVTGYAVEKLENEVFQKVYQGSCLFCEIKKNLEPATQYYFRIQALSDAGNSAYSNVCTVDTPPAPPGPVTNIKIIEQTSSSCLIQWKHPVDNGSVVYEYVLEATGATSLICTVQRPKPSSIDQNSSQESQKSHDDKHSKEESEESGDESGLEESDDEGIVQSSAGSETSSCSGSRIPKDTMEYKLTGLTADASYKLRIQAVNHCGAGLFSHPIQFFTKELPPSPPSLTASSISYHSVKLKWGDSSFSKKSVAVLSHTLQTQNKSGSFTSIYSGIGTSFTLSKLKELTPYCCRVRSRNDAGEGEFSKPKIWYTKAQPPANIKDLKGVEITSSSFKLVWSPCDKIRPDDRIEYVVQKQTENTKEFNEIYRGSKAHYLLKDLLPDHTYHVRILALRVLSDATRRSVPSFDTKEIKGVFSPLVRIRTLSEETVEGKIEDDCVDAENENNGDCKSFSDTQIAFLFLTGFLVICIIVAIILTGVFGSG